MMQPDSPKTIRDLTPQERELLMLFRALPKETAKRITETVKFETQQITAQEALEQGYTPCKDCWE